MLLINALLGGCIFFGSFSMRTPKQDVGIDDYEISTGLKSDNYYINRQWERELGEKYIDDEIYVYGDASLLEQVFANLFGNAIDAIKTEGTIKISITAENEIIIVSVSDNGQGIDDATRPDIFSPFYTTKEQDKGTGLGLYIVKNICDQHNISIECESQLQKGTTFIVKLNGKRKQHV